MGGASADIIKNSNKRKILNATNSTKDDSSTVVVIKFLLLHDQTIDLYCSDESPDLKYFCEFLLKLTK